MLGHLFGKDALDGFERSLRVASGSSLDEFVHSSLCCGAALMMLALGTMLALGVDDLYITFLPLLILFAPLVANYFIHMYRLEQRRLGMEKLVPDILLQASIFPQGSSIERIIEYIAGAGYGKLSGEFKIAADELERGASVADALGTIKKRNGSKVIGRAVDLLVLGYNSGADMADTFREAADDLLESNAIFRERNSSMLVEKYTLLFAGGLIVPMVLGMIVGLVGSFDFSALAEFGIGMDAAQREALLGAALFANTVYIAEYALLASAFVANQEGSARKTIVYAAVLLPLSQVVYACAQLL